MSNCSLHGTKMSLRKVRIQYGMLDYDRAWGVKKELFPNSNFISMGGCSIDPSSPSHVELLVCNRCREAERQWRKENEPA